MTDHQSRKITIHFTPKEDGLLHAFSDEVPEFYISGEDPREVIDDVLPVLERILWDNYGESIKAFDVSSFDAVKKELGLIPADQGKPTRGLHSQAHLESVKSAA